MKQIPYISNLFSMSFEIFQSQYYRGVENSGLTICPWNTNMCNIALPFLKANYSSVMRTSV